VVPANGSILIVGHLGLRHGVAQSLYYVTAIVMKDYHRIDYLAQMSHRLFASMPRNSNAITLPTVHGEWRIVTRR